jgi:hypothetical protein
MRPWLARTALVLAACAGMAVLTLALPLESWRTGDPGLATMQYDTPLPPLPAPRRVWIDSDAACGHGARTDPDDCLAIALLARTPAIEVVGISTVFGNAPRDVVDQTVDALIATLTASGGRPLPVWRGAAAPQADRRTRTPAQAALVAALEAGPLAIVALGPLTNVAAVLRERPQPAGAPVSSGRGRAGGVAARPRAGLQGLQFHARRRCGACAGGEQGRADAAALRRRAGHRDRTGRRGGAGRHRCTGPLARGAGAALARLLARADRARGLLPVRLGGGLRAGRACRWPGCGPPPCWCVAMGRPRPRHRHGPGCTAPAPPPASRRRWCGA